MHDSWNGVGNFLKSLEKTLRSYHTKDQLYNSIVNAPFASKIDAGHLFLGIIVLLIENPATKQIERIALSDTELARNTTKISNVAFHEIKIPIDNADNIIVKAIKSGTPQKTTDWKYLFTPVLEDQEARINQASGGIATSFVYPIKSINSRGALIFSYFQYPQDIGSDHDDFMSGYARIVAESLDPFSD